MEEVRISDTCIVGHIFYTAMCPFRAIYQKTHINKTDSSHMDAIIFKGAKGKNTILPQSPEVSLDRLHRPLVGFYPDDDQLQLRT